MYSVAQPLSDQPRNHSRQNPGIVFPLGGEGDLDKEQSALRFTDSWSMYWDVHRPFRYAPHGFNHQSCQLFRRLSAGQIGLELLRVLSREGALTFTMPMLTTSRSLE